MSLAQHAIDGGDFVTCANIAFERSEVADEISERLGKIGTVGAIDALVTILKNSPAGMLRSLARKRR